MENETREDDNSDFWKKIFKKADVFQKYKLLTDDEISSELKLFNKIITPEEEKEIIENISSNEIKEYFNYFVDKIFPISFLNFLKYCNIQEIENGKRYFVFYSLKDIRDLTISYSYPKWLKGGVPFASNGGGKHYVFDMRQNSINGEYPIYAVDLCNLGWETNGIYLLGNTFLEVVTGKKDVDDLFYP